MTNFRHMHTYLLFRPSKTEDHFIEVKVNTVFEWLLECFQKIHTLAQAHVRIQLMFIIINIWHFIWLPLILFSWNLCELAEGFRFSMPSQAGIPLNRLKLLVFVCAVRASKHVINLQIFVYWHWKLNRTSRNVALRSIWPLYLFLSPFAIL